MLEIEQKFRVPDHDAVRAALARLAATPGTDGEAGHAEEDQYFNAPDRDFAATGEAFRLRRVAAANVLTYKGPRQPGPTKTRPEVELKVAAGEGGAATATALLTHLGYRPVAVVRKHRQVFLVLRDSRLVSVCLDAVERVGTFVEVEVLAAAADAAAAQAAVQSVAADLGLTDPEPRSYLRMLLEQPA